MADLSQLKQSVDSLNKVTSNDEKVREVYGQIEKACINPANTNSVELSEILTNFRDNKLNARETLNRVRADVKDLDENLKLSIIGDRIKAINNRNLAINNLNTKLNEVAKKAKKDAELLKTIQTIVDKTTATIDVVKSFVDALQESDISTKDILNALIDAVNKFSSIFKPQNA